MTGQQFAVYEEFGRNLPGFMPATQMDYMGVPQKSMVSFFIPTQLFSFFLRVVCCPLCSGLSRKLHFQISVILHSGKFSLPFSGQQLHGQHCLVLPCFKVCVILLCVTVVLYLFGMYTW